MSKFSFITDDKAEAFCTGIAHSMVRRFGISENEAIGRINSQLQNITEWVGENHIYYHRGTEEWANDIYYDEDYEKKSVWWIEGSNPRPRPYP